MEFNVVGPRGILQIDDARIVYRNFAGEGNKFNQKGNRNFSIVIPDEDIAEQLRADGWNVKSKPARDEDEIPFMHLPVKIKFNDRGPTAYLKSGNKLIELDEESISCLDDVDIAYAEVDIRPFDWDVNGKTGRTAYLHSICITQEIDRFAAKYGSDE